MKNHAFRSPVFFAGILFCGLMMLLVYKSFVVETDIEQITLDTRTEKSKRMQNAGHPDLFAEYHQLIREGSNGKHYPQNYKLAELNKARSARKSPGRTLPWTERGPANVGGRTRAVVVDLDDPNHETWFVGSVGGGIWHTSDAGDTWRTVTDNLPNLSISSMAQATSNTDVMYAGTGEGYGNSNAIAGAGIFKTTDHGETWFQLESTVTNDFRYVNRLIIDPENEQVVVAATQTGIFRSIDGGMSWLEVYGDGSSVVQDIKYQPGNFSVQIAAQNLCCILKSTDAGQTWEVAYDTFFNPYGRIELATSEANPDWMYAAVELLDIDHGGDIYFSMDAGASWTYMVNPAASASNNWLGGQGWYNNTIAVHPYSPDTLFLGGIRWWKTNLQGSETSTGGAPTALNEIDTESFLDFVSFTDGSHFNSRVDVGTYAEQLLDVTGEDLTSIEIRFGPGKSQMAHRFTVSPTGGANGDGGAGIPYAQYIYADYVEVPFEVWDVDNNEQLMVSFRDQADDGVYNLLLRLTEGSRNFQSREYLFIHKIPYNATTPASQVAQTGGAAQKTIYFMWPVLVEGGTWDPANLPDSRLTIDFTRFEGRVRQQTRFFQPLTEGGEVHVDHHNITIIPVNAATNDFKIINATDGGVYYSEDSGSTWKSTLNGYITTQFYDVDKRAGSDDYIGGSQDNGTWRSFRDPFSDSEWRSIGIGDGFDAFWHPTDINRAVYSSQFNNILITTNGGFSFSSSTEGLNDVGVGAGPFLTSIGWSKDNPEVLFVVGNSGIWRSDDFTANWTLVRGVTPDQWGFFSGCKTRVSLANSDVVWAGCRMDAPTSTSTIRSLFLSRDGGQTFNQVARPAFFEENGVISGLATHPTLPSNAYAIFSHPEFPKIIHTTDYGETWTDLTGFAESTDGTSTNGFPDVAVYDILVMPGSLNVLWAATEIGIFVSNDSGASWSYSDNGLPAVAVWRLRYSEGQVMAATHGRGIWTVPEPLEVSNESEGLPEQFELAQNYPNPFNPETTISFTIPAPADVQIKVFDMNGREVSIITNQQYLAGRHNINWNASELASGTYFYKMTAGDFSDTRKMVIVK